MLASKQINSLLVTVRRCGSSQLGVSRPRSKGTFRCQAKSQRQVRRDAMQERQRNKSEKLRVLRLISACVESNVSSCFWHASGLLNLCSSSQRLM